VARRLHSAGGMQKTITTAFIFVLMLALMLASAGCFETYPV
jgi:hypothetical protein